MSKTLECNRTRLVPALFLFVLFCKASPAVGCSCERMSHVKHQSSMPRSLCLCQRIGRWQTGGIDATDNILSSLRSTHHLALTSLSHNQVKRPIPLKQPFLGESQPRLLPGCRYGYTNYGNAHGVQDGCDVTVKLQTRMTAAFGILTVEDRKAFGVYDAQSVELDHI